MANTTFSQLNTELNDPADSAILAVEQGATTQKMTKASLHKAIKTDVILTKSIDTPVSANAINLDVAKYSIFHVYVDAVVNTINVLNLSSTHDTNIEINYQQDNNGGYAINFGGLNIRWQRPPTNLNTQAGMLSTVRLKHRSGTNFWVGVFDGSTGTNGTSGGTGNVNLKPQIINFIPNGVATEQSAYSYQIPINTFADPEGGVLIWSASYVSWGTFDPATRTLSGVPTIAGTQAVTITVEDEHGARESNSFNIIISPAVASNSAPQIINAISDSTVTVGSSYIYTIPTNVFYDANSDVLTLASNASGWLTFNPATRTFSGTPSAGDIGTNSINVTATDPSNAFVTDQFNISVIAASGNNQPPTITNPIGNNVATEGAVFNYTFPANTFNDPDGDTLTYTSNTPAWLTFTPSTRTFNGTPAAGDVGTVNINVVAKDPGQLSVTDTFTIVISASGGGGNQAPIILNPIINQIATEASAFSFVVPANTFNDPDGDTLTYSSSSTSGGWLFFNPTTRTYTGTPIAATGGTSITVNTKATDPDGLNVTSSFTIAINNPQVITNSMRKGINSNWVSGWDNPQYFVNLARYMQEWTNFDTSVISTNQHKGKLTTNSSTANYRSLFSHPTQTRPAGNYTIRWTGTGQIGIGLNNPPTELPYTGTKNITVNLTSFTGMFVWFKGTNLDSLEIILPGMVAQYDGGNEWHPDYLTFLNSLNVQMIRSMNFTQSSLFVGRNFADLTKKSDVSFIEHMPVEVLCDLAERTGIDLWYDGPARGTDACFNSLAQEFATHLHANTILYLEAIGNEVWNTAASWNGNTNWIASLGAQRYNVTASSITNNITLNNHGLTTGDKIRLWLREDYGWNAPEKVQPWQGNSGNDMVVTVVNTNEFKVTGKWSNQLLVFNVDYSKFIISKESDVTYLLDANYAIRSNQVWDIFKNHLPANRMKFVLASQYGAPSRAGNRLNALPNLNTVDYVAGAPYYWVALWSVKLEVSGTQIIPKLYCTEFNASISVGIYASSANPTLQDVIDGTGNPVKHQNFTYPRAQKTYTSMTTMTGLTASAAYTCHAVLIDSYGMANKLEINFSQVTGTYTVVNTEDDLANREWVEISGKMRSNYAAHSLQGVEITGYEGGPHYSHNMPDSIITWLYDTYWKSAIAEKVYGDFLTIIAGLGFKDLNIYKDLSTTRFGLAIDYASMATDSRAKAFQSFGDSIPVINVPVLSAPALTMGSAVTNGLDLTNYQNGLTSSVAVGFSIVLGDDDGLFSITSGGMLSVGNKSKYDFSKTSTRVIGIKVDDGTTAIVQSQSFTLGGTGGIVGGDTSAGGGGGGTLTIANAIPDQSATEAQVFNYAFPANTFNDTAAGTLAYTSNASGWLNFNPANRNFSGTPTGAEVGTFSVSVTATNTTSNDNITDYFNILIASAGGGSSFLNLITPDAPATIQRIGLDPVTLISTDKYRVKQDGSSEFPLLQANSWLPAVANGNSITVSLTIDVIAIKTNALLQGLFIDVDAAQATKIFVGLNDSVIERSLTYTNTSGATVTPKFRLSASDDTFALDAHVSNISYTTGTGGGGGNNAPIVANPISNTVATDGTAFNLTFAANTFNDPDGDTLIYTANNPAWLTFTPATRTFTGTPSAADVGTLTINVTATDPSNAQVTDSFNVVISASGGGGGGGSFLNLITPAAPTTVQNIGLDPITLISADKYRFKQDGTNPSTLSQISTWMGVVQNGQTVTVSFTLDIIAVKLNGGIRVQFIGVDAAQATLSDVSLNDPVIERSITYTNASGADVTPKLRFSVYDDTFVTDAHISNLSFVKT